MTPPKAAGTAAPKDAPPDPPGELEVTLDLLAEDAALREAVGEPMTVRLPGGAVITVPHISGWPVNGTRFAAIGSWVLWARSVLNDDDFAAFQAADLREYHMKRVHDAVTAASGTSPGKPQPSTSSRGATARS